MFSRGNATFMPMLSAGKYGFPSRRMTWSAVASAAVRLSMMAFTGSHRDG